MNPVYLDHFQVEPEMENREPIGSREKRDRRRERGRGNKKSQKRKRKGRFFLEDHSTIRFRLSLKISIRALRAHMASFSDRGMGRSFMISIPHMGPPGTSFTGFSHSTLLGRPMFEARFRRSFPFHEKG
jgi:hypothetical protein